MDYRERYARLFAVVVGAVLIAVGVIGFFYESAFTSDVARRDAVFGILDVNGWHNAVHIVTGLVALALARTHAREFALGFGVVYLVVAVWGFIIGDGESILTIVPVKRRTTSSTRSSPWPASRSTRSPRPSGRTPCLRSGRRRPERRV